MPSSSRRDGPRSSTNLVLRFTVLALLPTAARGCCYGDRAPSLEESAFNAMTADPASAAERVGGPLGGGVGAAGRGRLQLGAAGGEAPDRPPLARAPVLTSA